MCIRDSLIAAEGEDDFQQASEGGNEQTQQNAEQDRARESQTKWYSCFIITKNYLHINNQEVFDALKGPNYSIYYKKLVSQSLIQCLNRIGYDDASHFLETITKAGGAGAVNIHNYFVHLGVDLALYREGKIPSTLTKSELEIFNYAEELEKNIKKNQEGAQTEEEGEQGGRGYQFEPSILGVNLKDTSSGFAALYFVLVVAAIGSVIFFGYKRLFPAGPRSEAERIRLERKKKKEEKKSKKAD
eukprot:TRINITY_DN669_c0_g1_i4.p1 TRINITY_DN669_c0_g1~~TRINITY_DN669_c0_g1_i4.p1  ORF type:complete len:276 (+),score=108.64 TRINITY_DN669_c0_g1_i4:98-829(+)